MLMYSVLEDATPNCYIYDVWIWTLSVSAFQSSCCFVLQME